jgi:hypothetical protein
LGRKHFENISRQRMVSFGMDSEKVPFIDKAI